MSLDLARKIKIPAWWPSERRQELSGRKITLRVPYGVRKRTRKKERIPYAQWNELYRVMGQAESYPGRWNKEFAPHSAWIMEIWEKPWTRELAFCGPDQASKTNTMIGCMLPTIDMDPCNMFYTAAGEHKSKEIFTDKILAGIKASPRLKHVISTRADDTGMSKAKLNIGMTIRVAWANSPASTASFSARETYNDEIDKWAAIGNETNAIRRIQKRAKNFPLTYKHFWSSTPAGLYIYKMCMESQQVFTHAARCPDCMELVVMDRDHLIIPPGSTEQSIKDNPDDVAYSCNACGSLWDEEKRQWAYRNGDKYCIKGDPTAKASFVGVHLTGYVTPDMSMARIACTILAAEAGDIDAQKDLAHGIECKNWEPQATPIATEETILRYRSDLPRNLVPADTARICLLVDTQQASYYYQVWAYGFAPEIRMHMVAHGIVEQNTDLEGMLREVYLDYEDRQFRLANGLKDSGGTRRGYQKHSRTVEVYEWCSRNRTIMPIKGIPGKNGDMISYKTIETYPGTNKPIKGGLKRANIRVDYFKDELERRLTYEIDDPQALSFHNGIDEAFARHYTGETKNEHDEWTHSKRNQRIDYWDCTVYALALREMMKRSIPMKPSEAAPVQRRVLSKGVRHE